MEEDEFGVGSGGNGSLDGVKSALTAWALLSMPAGTDARQRFESPRCALRFADYGG